MWTKASLLFFRTEVDFSETFVLQANTVNQGGRAKQTPCLFPAATIMVHLFMSLSAPNAVWQTGRNLQERRSSIIWQNSADQLEKRLQYPKIHMEPVLERLQLFSEEANLYPDLSDFQSVPSKLYH